MIQLTDCLGIMGPIISDNNKRLIILSVIQLSGGHCITIIIENTALAIFNYNFKQSF